MKCFDEPQLCDSNCGTLECHSFGCVILNSQSPNKKEAEVKEPELKAPPPAREFPVMMC